MADREGTVIGPNSFALEALRVAQFTKPRKLTKPNGQEITTRLVIEGAGMVGLADRVENKEWAGIFNHYMKVGGGFLLLGRLLQLNGHQVDLQLAVNTSTLSHSGRRQYDEATWYPDEIDAVLKQRGVESDSASKRKELGDTKIGVANLIQRSDIPTELIKMVSAHEIGGFYPFDGYHTWNETLPLYLDFRISQDAMPMEQRFEDLQRGVPGRYSQEFLDRTHQWAIDKEQMLFTALHLPSYEAVMATPEHLKARVDTASKLGKFSETEVQALQETRAYKPKSGKDTDPTEVIGLTPDEFLEKLQLHPEDINERFLQPERWERYIRRLYINDAEHEILTRLSGLKIALKAWEDFGGSPAIETMLAILDAEFPPSSWWGKYVNELYRVSSGQPYNPKTKPVGINRAIEFYRKIEQREQAREEETA